jgi:hypothetical protein
MTGTGGSSTATGGTTGTGGGSGGATTGTGGSGGMVGGTGGSGGGSATCEARTAFTLAIHIVLDVSWPDTLGANAGTGKFHLWNIARMTANGTSTTGMTQPCGSGLPELTLKPLVGGGKTLVEVPHTVWEGPNAPKFPSTGTISGWNPGSTITTQPTNALVGLMLANGDAAWPDSYTGITPADTDGDGNPGITGIPRSGSGYVLPPVSTPILGLGSKADKVYLVSRTAVGLMGTMSSCTEQSGTVNVKWFDNHVVGCHVEGGSECNATQIDFIDTNRTKYTVTGGTFTSKLVPDTITCAEARGM